MTGTIILVVLAVAIIAALKLSHRRNSGPAKGPSGSWTRDDRDTARTKLDLLALGEKAQPFTRSHGRHAA